MSQIILIIEGGYAAKALGYSIHTEGETIDESKRILKMR